MASATLDRIEVARGETCLSAADFLLFRDFFKRVAGIHFDESKRYFVDKRLIDRMDAAGCGDLRRYLTMLGANAGAAELQQLINAMTINETYFFRESYQFDCMVNSLLGEIVARKPAGGRIRIWSVPSATGEEPYSIAIYLLELWPLISAYEVEILSSDIDTDVLAAAERGVYSPRAVAQLPRAYLRRYFSGDEESGYVISRKLVDAVAFSKVNLADPASTQAFRDVDLIFCRNLLIYFDDAVRDKALRGMFDALNPGGFLCLGHSETLGRHSALRFRERSFPDAIVYQKPVDAPAP
jgi:chemotaxis protein methyltransferase CheR